MRHGMLLVIVLIKIERVKHVVIPANLFQCSRLGLSRTASFSGSRRGVLEAATAASMFSMQVHMQVW